MSEQMRNFMNRIMKPLLGSPLHFLVSGWCMLITVRGRKTGNLYTTPVYYMRDGNCICFYSGKALHWIKNLTGGAQVTLRLQGRDVRGWAAICPGDVTEQPLFKRMYPRMTAEDAAKLVRIEVRI